MSKVSMASFVNPSDFVTFRSGEVAEIVGVRMVKPEGLHWRPCFVLRYADGIEDLTPIYDTGTENSVMLPSEAMRRD